MIQSVDVSPHHPKDAYGPKFLVPHCWKNVVTFTYPQPSGFIVSTTVDLYGPAKRKINLQNIESATTEYVQKSTVGYKIQVASG